MEKRFGFLIKQISLAHKEYVNDFLKQFDLTTAQFSVLIEVFKAEDLGFQLSQKDIEERLQISNPTVTGILNRLEAKELIERVSCSKDKRIRHIYSTSKARAMDVQLKKSFDRFDRRLVEGFSPEEEEQLFEFLVRAFKNAKNKEGKHDKKISTGN